MGVGGGGWGRDCQSHHLQCSRITSHLKHLGLLPTLYFGEENREMTQVIISITSFDLIVFLDTIYLQQFPVLLSSYFIVLSLFLSRVQMIDSKTGTSGGFLASSCGLFNPSSLTDFYVKYNHLASALRTRALSLDYRHECGK